MKRVGVPFKPGQRLRMGGDFHEVKHIDFGSNRLQLKAVASGVVQQLELHLQVTALYEGSIELYDELGVLLDFSELSADVLALSPAKKAAFQRRVAYVRELDPLGALGPENEGFMQAVKALNDKHGGQVSPAAAYAWLQVYRKERSFRALATPRAEADDGEHHAARMHPLTRLALDEELASQAAALEQRLKDQRGELKIRGRTHLSLNAITTNARARVRRLHVAKHQAVNTARTEAGLPPLPLPPVPVGPSRRTVQLEVCSSLSRHKLLESVYGHHVTKRRLGPFGHSFGLSRICERWETDVFLADILLTVIYQGVAVPVGIPYLTVIIDCFSGVVLAIIVEFKPPNYRSFLAALKQAYTPKDWLFEAFPGIRNRFTAHGAAEVIGFDNAGMFSTEDVRRAEADLSIILDPAEPRTPNDKPFIEGFGSVTNCSFIRYQVGNKQSIEMARRMEYDVYKQRAMPVEEFVKRLWMWVWNDLQERPMEDRHGWSRRQTWCYSLQSLAQSDDVADLFILDKKTIDLQIAARHQLRYTDEGLAISGRHYRSAEMHEVAMRFPPKFQFDVREDVGNPGLVRVVHPQDGRVIEVPIASELPPFLTADAFNHVREAKARMADVDLATLLDATVANRDAWKYGKPIEHVPSSTSALRDIISQKDMAKRLAGELTADKDPQTDTTRIREALRRQLKGAQSD